MTSAPRLAPRPAARTGFSCGVRLPDSSYERAPGWGGLPCRSAVYPEARIPLHHAASAPLRRALAFLALNTGAAPEPRGAHLSGVLSCRPPPAAFSHASNCR